MNSEQCRLCVNGPFSTILWYPLIVHNHKTYNELHHYYADFL